MKEKIYITKEQEKQIKKLLLKGYKTTKKLDILEYQLLSRISDLQLEQIKLRNCSDSDKNSFSEYCYTHNAGEVYGLEYALKLIRGK